MDTIRRSSVLPIPAATAVELARKPQLFAYVVAPWLRISDLRMPDRIEVGASGSARLWWLGVVPSWRHHLVVVHLTDDEIRTNEHGGPVRTWNHRLTFEPLDASSCRYTDEIEVESGPRGLPTRAFARLMLRHRHRRWRALARVLA